jgi:hypothetical protein
VEGQAVRLVVVDVLKGGPASRARPLISAGDTLLSIDGQAVPAADVTAAQKMLMGPTGSSGLLKQPLFSRSHAHCPQKCPIFCPEKSPIYHTHNRVLHPPDTCGAQCCYGCGHISTHASITCPSSAALPRCARPLRQGWQLALWGQVAGVAVAAGGWRGLWKGRGTGAGT